VTGVDQPRGLPAPTSLWYLVVAVTLWRLAAAHFLPVTQDEAYYFDWARHLDWGYFDHPPGVAFLGIGTWLADASPLAARLGTVIAATLTLLVLIRFYRGCGLSETRDLILAAVLGVTTLPGIATGVIATPDTALALCWVLALHEALAALRGRRRRWLSAGLATGAGLLGKYTMVLIGPVFLWAILWVDPRALRTPWPYLGLLLALLVFSPNIVWNAENDWLTMRFQFGHGFATDSGELLRDVGRAADDAAETPMTMAERGSSLLAYLSAQAGLWGLIALVGAAALVTRERPVPYRTLLSGVLDRPALALLSAAALFPLLFFAVISTFSEVEANWPAVYLAAAVPFATVALRRTRRWAMLAAGGNLLLASLYVYHGATAALPLPDNQNRILRETHGYEALAAEAAKLPGPVFAARYQTTAMLNFYRPGLHANQWPGLTRPSEYLRGHIARPPTAEEIARAGGFWLITSRAAAPDLGGYAGTRLRELIDCAGRTLTDANGATPCARPLHVWRVYRYVPRPGTAPKPGG
jgi:4-amino-4-deoxy-L-arabinose transferase-like glycosyltransferase